MVFISIYLVIGIIGLIYSFLSRGKLVYINAPEDILPSEEKWKILKTHIFTAIILGVIIVNVIIRSFQPEIYSKLEVNGYLAYSIIGAILVSFMIISGIIQIHLIKHNVHFSNTNFIRNNPEILIPEEHYQTTKMFEDNEFWNLIATITFDHNKKEFDFSQFETLISKYHPSKIVEFYQTLISKKIDLVKSGILTPYTFIFRKYQDDFHFEFCELIILNGQEKFNKIIKDLDETSTIEFDFLKIKRYNLTGVLGNVFLQKTRKPIVTFIDFEDISMYYQEISSSESVKNELPRVHQKFK